MSNIKGIRSDIWYKMKYHQPVDLTVTLETGSSGTASAVLLGKQIIVTLNSTAVDKWVNISTPLGFRVIRAYSIHTDANDYAWALYNTGSAITNTVAVAAVDKDIDRATKINDAYSAFARNDDDLRIEITTDAAVAIIVIDIEPTIA